MSDEILIELPINEADPAETDRLAQTLRRELLEITEVNAVTAPVAGPAPPGAKGLDFGALGALLVSVKPTVTLVTNVIGVVRGWLDRTGGTMELTLNGQTIVLKPTREQQQELIAHFIANTSEPTEPV